MIARYKERCDGLEEMNKLLCGLIYCLIDTDGERAISKQMLGENVCRSSISFRQDNENYYVSSNHAKVSSPVENGDGEEKA